jgi:outer membrane protein assembly factor BamD (BamD/ComL family)
MISWPVVLALAVAFAPIQCGKSYDPALSRDETPGDALWQLARRFREQNDEAAARRTLEYLVEQYPASRWAAAARDDLDHAGGDARDGGAG